MLLTAKSGDSIEARLAGKHETGRWLGIAALWNAGFTRAKGASRDSASRRVPCLVGTLCSAAAPNLDVRRLHVKTQCGIRGIKSLAVVKYKRRGCVVQSRCRKKGDNRPGANDSS